jgi:hypothetical protein
VGASEEESRRLVIESMSAAHRCAQLVDERSRAGAQGRSINRLSKAFARIARCAARGSARLRQDLDQALIELLRGDPVDLEDMEAILEAAGTTFARYPTEEPARTALSALGASEEDSARRYALKLDFESLPSALHLRMQTMLSELAASTPGDLSAARIFSTMASALEIEVNRADPEIATLITDYVDAVADLCRPAGLRPGRAHKPDDPEYKSNFHRFADLVLTAVMEPGSRRHDGYLDEHRRALWEAHAKLDDEHKQAGKEPRRVDVRMAGQ